MRTAVGGGLDTGDLLRKKLNRQVLEEGSAESFSGASVRRSSKGQRSESW